MWSQDVPKCGLKTYLDGFKTYPMWSQDVPRVWISLWISLWIDLYNMWTNCFTNVALDKLMFALKYLISGVAVRYLGVAFKTEQYLEV